MEIGVHELVDEVDVGVPVAVLRLNDVAHGDDVLVLEVPQEADLAEGAAGVREVLEGVADLLDGDLCSIEGSASGNSCHRSRLGEERGGKGRRKRSSSCRVGERGLGGGSQPTVPSRCSRSSWRSTRRRRRPSRWP